MGQLAHPILYRLRLVLFILVPYLFNTNDNVHNKSDSVAY